jgi:hypothetical protein
MSSYRWYYTYTDSRWYHIQQLSENPDLEIPRSDSELDHLAMALHAMQQGVISEVRVHGLSVFTEDIEKTGGVLALDDVLNYWIHDEVRYATVQELLKGKLK